MSAIMQNIKSRNKWQSVVRRAVSHERKQNRILPGAWKGFAHSEIDLLFRLEDRDATTETIKDEFALLALVQNGSASFIEQCLYTSMGTDKHSFQDRFIPFFQQINEWIHEGKITCITQSKLNQSLLLHLIERQEVDNIKLFLSVTNSYYKHSTCISGDDTHDGEEITAKFTAVPPDDNDPALLLACHRKNYQVVQALVAAGYR